MENLYQLTEDWTKYTHGKLLDSYGNSCLIGHCLLKKGVIPDDLRKYTMAYASAQRLLGLNVNQVSMLTNLNDMGFVYTNGRHIKICDSLDRWYLLPDYEKISRIRNFIRDRIGEIEWFT